MQAQVARQSPPILLGTRIFHSPPFMPMHAWASAQHGATLHVIGPLIGSDWTAVPIIANQPRQAIPAPVGARARAAGIDGPVMPRSQLPGTLIPIAMPVA
jgi:hypothetical protein